jgi:hypothetical protein
MSGVARPPLPPGAACCCFNACCHERIVVANSHAAGRLCACSRSGSTQVASAPAPTAGSSPPLPTREPEAYANTRRTRFAKLVEVRALYRDLMRARALLKLPSPIYVPLPPLEGEADEGRARVGGGRVCGMALVVDRTTFWYPVHAHALVAALQASDLVLVPNPYLT